jgi:hypothetical protein
MSRRSSRSHGWRITTRIEISLNRLDPPQGVAVRFRQEDDLPSEAQGFVGWLELFGVLQSIAAEQVDP